MARRGTFETDEIGHGSEIKLDIIREYAAANSKIRAAQSSPRLHHVDIDGFAGDLDGRKVASLTAIAANLKELGHGG